MEQENPINVAEAIAGTAPQEATPQGGTKKKRLFRWALWWGLGITVMSIAMMFIPGMDDGSGDPIGAELYSYIDRSFWLLIISVGIITPALEECIFRSWGNGKKWTGILSSVLMALVMWGNLNWMVALVSLAAGLGITLAIKQREKRLLAMMLLSAVLFMLAHIENYSWTDPSSLLAMVEKVGFSLLAAYLVINHNLWWSIGLHVINNSLVCLAMLLAVNYLEPVEFTTERGDQVSLRSLVRDHETTVAYCIDTDGDTLRINNNLSSIARLLLENQGRNYNRTVFYVTDYSRHRQNYALQVVCPAGEGHDLLAIVRGMEREGLIHLDTSTAQAYYVQPVDSTLNTGRQGPNTWNAYWLQSYGLPIIDTPTFDFDTWAVEGELESATIDGARQLLEQNGLSLQPANRRMTMIRITTTHNALEDL